MDHREWCWRCAISLAAVLAVPHLVKFIAVAEINWAAIGSIASAAAAAAAAITIAMALRIDAKAAARVRDREARDATPLAFAFQREMHLVYGLTEAVIRGPENFPGIPRAELAWQLASVAQRFRAKTLEDSIRNLGCFEAEVGKHLAIAYAAINALQEALQIPEQPPPDFADFVLEGMKDAAIYTRKTVWAAGFLLERYTKTPMPTFDPLTELDSPAPEE